MSAEPIPNVENFLREKLQTDPLDWQTRRRLAHVLYDKESYEEAANLVWMAEQIPSTDIDLAFAARVLAKAQPRKAIRLLTAVLEQNRGKAAQNMGMANALLHHGMVLQAARFYGAALEADPSWANPDIEHFVLWSDDECTMWGDFNKRKMKLGDLPWMVRDPKEALKLTSSISIHTTPISVPNLPESPGEQLRQGIYQQEAMKNAKITPPPSVTIPIDRVDPKHRVFDATYGAVTTVRDKPAVPVVIPETNGNGAPSSVTIKGNAIPTNPSVIGPPKPIVTQPPNTAPLKPLPPLPPIPKAVAVPLVIAPRPTVAMPPRVGPPSPAPTRRLLTPAPATKKVSPPSVTVPPETKPGAGT